MKSLLRSKLDEIKPHVEKGGKYEKWYFIYEAHETLFFQPNHTTGVKGAHIRDAVDMKRMMVTVILAMIPALIFGMWNVGNQHAMAVGLSAGFVDNLLFGAIRLVPIIAVSYIVGLGIEFAFATINKHPINEGFLVSGLLLPLIVPATIPLWQVGVATAFAVVLGKEVFGGTGMNLLNPALTARAFLFFAYPVEISGDKVWIDLAQQTAVDGFSGATVLGRIAEASINNVATFDAVKDLPSFSDMFMGNIPGSIGETSTLMCLIGFAILAITGVGSWKIVLSMFAGGLTMGAIVASGDGAWATVPAHYQVVMGGFAFGAVFMATDPVSAAQTEVGKFIYGFLAGFLSILVRVLNPAYPEGVMLAILLMNVFAPLIDYFVVQSNKNRRLKRETV
ncbi:MAG: NADH:ubiquinone reductase (Na(+)-transporting) subunit B [Cytophagales bacterium]|nr:NADH:ubiquinone reductase (Na(+)-transporting) subunit B [Cytophagales bacterium]